jgi:2-methylisocitrate lyase-like PEP mutase family enzyme
MSHHIQALRDIVASRSGVLLPGAPNALATRIIADLGFRAIYLTGAGLTNMSLGLPDLGFMDLSQAVAHTMAIRNVTELPIVVDADTGFGDAVNVTHTVRMSGLGPVLSRSRTRPRPSVAAISRARNLFRPRKCHQGQGGS